MENQKILNPITKRYVKVGSQQFNKLVLEGLIKVEFPKAEDIKVEIPTVAVPPIKGLLAEELTNIVKENKKQLTKEMSQKECDRLLKKLLYEKLCISKKKPEKKDKPEKKKKKIKFKVKTPEPESESESQSESDDSS